MGTSFPRFRKFEPDLLGRKGEAVSLLGPGDLLEMLHATLEKGAIFRFLTPHMAAPTSHCKEMACIIVMKEHL